MNSNIKTNNIADILAAIRASLSDANSWLQRGGDAGWRVQGAFIRTRLLLEALGLPEALKDIQKIEAAAVDNWGKVEIDEEETGEPYLAWAARLHQYLWALEDTLGEPKNIDCLERCHTDTQSYPILDY